MTDCTYCGCEVEAHDPLAVYETGDGDSDGDGPESGTLAGEFCNWGCLAAYVAESDVATGTSCNWTPDA
jgi:hypothetical protein